MAMSPVIIFSIFLSILRESNVTGRVALSNVWIMLVFNVASGVLLPIRGEETKVLGVVSIPVAILPSCQDMKTFAL